MTKSWAGPENEARNEIFVTIGVDWELGEVMEIETQNNNSDALTRVIEVMGPWCSQYEGCTSMQNES